MKKGLVYDFPTRLFHWCFSGLFISAFFIAKIIDSDSVVFIFHMLLGINLGFLVFLRFFWGLFGTQHARWSDLDLHPRNLASYLKGVVKGDSKKWAGHNPASSWAALLMIFFAVGLVTTGLLMTGGGYKEDLEDIHDVLATSFAIVAFFHISGIVIHTLRFKDGIGFSMVHGKKEGVLADETLSSSRPFSGLIFLALALSFAAWIFWRVDLQEGILNLWGLELNLGKPEY